MLQLEQNRPQMVSRSDHMQDGTYFLHNLIFNPAAHSVCQYERAGGTPVILQTLNTAIFFKGGFHLYIKN